MQMQTTQEITQTTTGKAYGKRTRPANWRTPRVAKATELTLSRKIINLNRMTTVRRLALSFAIVYNMLSHETKQLTP